MRVRHQSYYLIFFEFMKRKKNLLPSHELTVCVPMYVSKTVLRGTFSFENLPCGNQYPREKEEKGL